MIKWGANRILLNDPLRYRLIIFGVIGAVYFLACLHRISPTVVALDLFLEFGADATALGLMSSAYFYMYAAVQPPVGLLSDTLGPRRVITLFTLIACMGSVVFGTAPNITMATIGRALIGIGVGGVFVPGLKIFSRWYNEREFPAVTGRYLALGNLGNLSASLPLTYLVLLMGWRGSFLSIGGISFILAVICWVIVRDQPEAMGWRSIQSGDSPPTPRPEDHAGANPPPERLRMIFGRPVFWIVALSYFFVGGPSLTFQGLWAVPYLMDVYEFSRVRAGGLLIFIPLGFIIGAFISGSIAGRLSISRKLTLLLFLSLGVISWTVFFITKGKPHASFIIPLFLILGICGGGSGTLYMTIVKELFPHQLTGTALGLINPAPFLSTALFQPFTGFLMDAVGRSGSAYPLEAYYHVFIFFFISLSISFAVIIPLPAKEKKAPSVSLEAPIEKP
ncbi:MAG: MFS transporter [Desulfobacteraceae bacterium]|nr:MFS transporter [Desulfobacteraceae bacterium]